VSDLYANWAHVYDYFYPDRAGEVAFWADLADGYGRQVLDLMCGTAEVSLGLARHGYCVLGDACAIPAPDGAFDFALLGGSGSFNHLAGDGALAALRELRRVLRPGGGLGMELVNPFLLGEIDPERTFGPLRPTPPGVWVERTSTNRYDREAGLFQIEQVTRTQIDGERGEFAESFALHVWQPDQVRELLEGAGFGDARFYGDYELGPFAQWSSDLLVVAGRSRTGPEHGRGLGRETFAHRAFPTLGTRA
jgi:SAM-dependent methyltransferase